MDLTFTATRRGRICFSEVFPQAISDDVEGKFFVRCNFPTGGLYDPERILDRHRHLELVPSTPGLGWTEALMLERWHNPFRPSSPLPSPLAQLRYEMYDLEEQ